MEKFTFGERQQLPVYALVLTQMDKFSQYTKKTPKASATRGKVLFIFHTIQRVKLKFEYLTKYIQLSTTTY